MADSLEEMAYAEAIRALAAQEGNLNALRTRSATVLSSVGGCQPGRLAVLAFTALFVLWPRGFRFSNDVSDLICDADDERDGTVQSTVQEVSRDWAYWTTKNYETNQDIIECQTNVYAVGLAAVALEVICLGLALLFR